MNIKKLIEGESKYLTGEDIVGRVVPVIVSNVTNETIKDPKTGQEKEKAVLYFEGKNKGLPLNIGNGATVCGAYGTDSEDIIGKPMELFTIMGTMNGVTSPWVRVRIPQQTQQQVPPVSQPEDTRDFNSEPVQDEIPFD